LNFIVSEIAKIRNNIVFIGLYSELLL